jgi:cell shape-determining protein MreD
MKTKLVLTSTVGTGVLALIAAAYCFWLMDNPLSYRWVPVVITGFLLALFVFVIFLVTLFFAPDALASIASSIESSKDQADRLTRPLDRR